ncbi:hypothetical protein [Candidatus Entotheonella palauensis]|nr:hypothetical protein [Candidatus Entotheonella palauensis]
MTRYLRLLILIVSLGWFLAAEVRAALDATRWRPSQADTPVWWDNIEGAPFWIRGPKPQFDRARKMHRVSLQRAAARQLGDSTRHRHLLPSQKAAVQSQYFGWFVTPRLAPLDHALGAVLAVASIRQSHGGRSSLG